MISIKEVTKQTGISVRTLRYYDEIDLLPPAGKTEGGHRLYGEKELKKLQEIQFLKTLDFSLKEIKTMLSSEEWNWTLGLQNQLNYIVKEKKKIHEIESTLQGLLNSLTIEGEIDLRHIQNLIQLYQNNATKKEEYKNKYFHPKEHQLLDLLPNMNRDDPDSLEWIALIGQLKTHMDKGEESIVIQQIIRRIEEKVNQTFGNNDDFFTKVWEIRKSPEKSEEAGFYPMDEELLTFFEKAWDVYEKSKS